MMMMEEFCSWLVPRNSCRNGHGLPLVWSAKARVFPYPITKHGGCTSFARKGASAYQEQSCVSATTAVIRLISRMYATPLRFHFFLKSYGVPSLEVPHDRPTPTQSAPATRNVIQCRHKSKLVFRSGCIYATLGLKHETGPWKRR